MKRLMIVLALLAVAFPSGAAQAGIFGRHRRPQPAQQSRPSSPALSHSTLSRNPSDWHEAHRGYGVKLWGW